MSYTRFILLLFIFWGHSAFAQKPKEFTIAFYNVENLYDTINDPAVDDEEFLPNGKNKWTGDHYHRKLKNLARVIDSLGGGPDILGVCEVENREVLEDLSKEKRLLQRNYQVVHAHSTDRRGIDVALLYRKNVFEFLFQRSIRVNYNNDTSFRTRDILLTKGLAHGIPLYIFVNHWPSRRGGEEASRPKRMAAALAVRYSIDTILAANPGANIVLMGDFNDTPNDSSILSGLKATGKMEGIEKFQLFNTLAQRAGNGEGSHAYRGEFSMLDQLMVSSAIVSGQQAIQYIPESASIYKPEWMHDKYAKEKGTPYRTYNGPKFIGGYSDHFPVYAKFQIIPKRSKKK